MFFTNLIRGVLGGLGIITKTLKFTTANNAEFMRSLQPGHIILTRSVTPNFTQGGIQAVTDSAWQHALIYVGKTAATMMRQLIPALEFNPKIPMDAREHEIIEAEGEGIQCNTLDKNLGDNTQMVAYIRKISTVDLIKILTRAYSSVGKPYDFLEFLGDLGEPIATLVGNPAELFVCSSLAAHCWEPVERIVKPNVDITRATPRDINDGLEPRLTWAKTKYNW